MIVAVVFCVFYFEAQKGFAQNCGGVSFVHGVFEPFSRSDTIAANRFVLVKTGKRADIFVSVWEDPPIDHSIVKFYLPQQKNKKGVMAEYKQLYQSSCMIDHTKQVLASMLQHQPLDNSSKSIHKFLQFTCQTLLAPSHFALFSPHELQTLVIANLSVHGITAIQSLLDALVSCGSNASIHLQNIAHVLSVLCLDEKWMEREIGRAHV